MPQTTSEIIKSNPNNDLFDSGLFFPQSIGMFVSSIFFVLFAYFLKGRKNKEVITFVDKKAYFNIVTGLFQALGMLTYIISVDLNGTSVTSPMVQFSVIIAVILGFV
jgi:glucose uptake protein GlcU